MCGIGTSVNREDSRDRKETTLKESVLEAVGIDEDGEILVAIDSILQSVKTGYEASQKGLCLFCAGFEGRDRKGNLEIYYDVNDRWRFKVGTSDTFSQGGLLT